MRWINALLRRIDGIIAKYKHWWAFGSFMIAVGLPIAAAVIWLVEVMVPLWVPIVGITLFAGAMGMIGLLQLKSMRGLDRLRELEARVSEASTRGDPNPDAANPRVGEPPTSDPVELLADTNEDFGLPEQKYDVATGTVVDAGPRLAVEWGGARLEYHPPVGRVKLRIEICVHLVNDIEVDAEAQALGGRIEVRPLSTIEDFVSFELEELRLLTAFSLPDRTRKREYITLIGNVPDTRKVRRALVALNQNSSGRCVAVRVTCQWLLNWDGESHEAQLHLRSDTQHLWMGDSDNTQAIARCLEDV